VNYDAEKFWLDYEDETIKKFSVEQEKIKDS